MPKELSDEIAFLYESLNRQVALNMELSATLQKLGEESVKLKIQIDSLEDDFEKIKNYLIPLGLALQCGR